MKFLLCIVFWPAIMASLLRTKQPPSARLFTTHNFATSQRATSQGKELLLLSSQRRETFPTVLLVEVQ